MKMILAILMLTSAAQAQTFKITERSSFVITERGIGETQTRQVISGDTQKTVTKTKSRYLAMFTANYCGPCRVWKETEKQKVVNAGHFVREYEMTDAKWRQKYAERITRVPSFVVCDWETGAWIGEQIVGAVPAESLLPLLRAEEPEKTVTRGTSQAELISIHNACHGGGRWSWPGDLKTHLRSVHKVVIE